MVKFLVVKKIRVYVVLDFKIYIYIYIYELHGKIW